jgi:predicted phage tail protein
MNTESAQVFLNKIKDKINKGEYDKELTVPFMKKESIYASVKARVTKKLETGGTPLLSEAEIKDAIQDAKEVAAISLALFSKVGILEKTEAGWIVTSKGEKLLSHLKPY